MPTDTARWLRGGVEIVNGRIDDHCLATTPTRRDRRRTMSLTPYETGRRLRHLALRICARTRAAALPLLTGGGVGGHVAPTVDARYLPSRAALKSAEKP